MNSPKNFGTILGKEFLKTILLHSRECKYRPRVHLCTNGFPERSFLHVLVGCRGVLKIDCQFILDRANSPCGYCDSILQNASLASTVELSQCRLCKERLPAFVKEKTKGQQLKGKIVLGTFSHFLAIFHTFSHFFRVFQNFTSTTFS